MSLSEQLQNRVSGVRASPPVQIFYKMKKVLTYIKESYDELVYKVSWPTRSELTNSAVAVLYASLIIAVLVFVMDFCFQHVMEDVIYPH
jgi:preprotein translocase subunit SecE